MQVAGIASFPNQTMMQHMNKKSHIPFHQKRATMGNIESMNRTLDNGHFQDSISQDAK